MTFDLATPESEVFRKPLFSRNPSLKYLGYNPDGTKNLFGKISSWMPGVGIANNVLAQSVSEGTDTNEVIKDDFSSAVNKTMSVFDVAKIAAGAYTGNTSMVTGGVESLAQNVVPLFAPKRENPLLKSPSTTMQFKEGGSVEKDPPKKNVLYVSDKNDPRYKAYQDSLSLYNKSKKDIGKYGNSEKNTDLYVRKGVNAKEFMKSYYDFVNQRAINKSGMFENNMNPNLSFPAPKIKQRIMPIGGIGINEGNSMGGWYNVYKKPTQPVELNPPIQRNKIDTPNQLTPISYQQQEMSVDYPQIAYQLPVNADFYNPERVVGSEYNQNSDASYGRFQKRKSEYYDKLLQKMNSKDGAIMRFADGGSFDRAFALARKKKGAGNTFEYNGKLYTTDYKEEVDGSQNVSAMQYQKIGTSPVINGPISKMMDIDSVKNRIASAETKSYSNPYIAVNKTSGALGKYQFLPSTLRGLGITNTQAFLNNPKLQEEVMSTFIKKDLLPAATKAVALDPSTSLEEAMGGVHFMGATGFLRAIKNRTLDQKVTSNNPSYNQYRSRMYGNYFKGGVPETENYEVYSDKDDSEDISMFDEKTGELVGRMRWGELIFDQKAKETIDSLIKKGDVKKLGEYVKKERGTHKQLTFNMAPGAELEDPTKLLQQLEAQLAKAQQEVTNEKARAASDAEKKRNIDIANKKVSALKSALFALSENNKETAVGMGLYAGNSKTKSLEQRIKEAQPFLNQYKSYGGSMPESLENQTSAAAKGDYPISTRNADGSKELRFREMGNGVYQRDNGQIYLQDPKTRKLYDSTSQTYKNLLSSEYVMDSQDGIPYKKLATTTTGSGSGRSGGRGNGKRKTDLSISPAQILGGTIGGTGKNQRAFISDPNTQPEPPSTTPFQAKDNILAMELGNPNSSKIAQAKGRFASSITGDTYTPSSAETSSSKFGNFLGENGEALSVIGSNLARGAIGVMGMRQAQPYERDSKWNSFVSSLKDETQRGVDPATLSAIDRGFGMQLSAIRNTAGGGMTGGALAGILGNTASQYSNSIVGADREAYLRRSNALGMYGNALAQNEQTNLMNYQNNYNQIQQNNAINAQVISGSFDDTIQRLEAIKTGKLEDKYLQSVVDLENRKLEFLKQQANSALGLGSNTKK